MALCFFPFWEAGASNFGMGFQKTKNSEKNEKGRFFEKFLNLLPTRSLKSYESIIWPFGLCDGIPGALRVLTTTESEINRTIRMS